MKKLFSGLCITLCLLFSVAATAVRADEGNGHDGGFVCVETETVDCPTNVTPPPPPIITSGSSNDAAEAENDTAAEEDAFLTLLELIIGLLP